MPVKRINGALLMCHKHAARALVELMAIGKTPSSPNPVFHHAPEPCNRIEVMTSPDRQEIQAQLLVPVRQRGRELVGTVDATAVNDHDNLLPGVAKERHPLMAIVTKSLGIKLRDALVEDFRGALVDSAQDTEHDPTGHAPPTPRVPPRLPFARLFVFDLAGAEGAGGEAKPLGCMAPPARPRECKTPDARFIFLEQNHRAPLGAVFEGSQRA